MNNAGWSRLFGSRNIPRLLIGARVLLTREDGPGGDRPVCDSNGASDSNELLSSEAVLAASSPNQCIGSTQEVRPSFAGSLLVGNGLTSYTL